MMSASVFLLYLAAGWAGYLVVGRLTAALWKRWLPAALPPEDIRAIRILWWVFLPLGLSLYMIDSLAWGVERIAPTGKDYQVDWAALAQTVHSEKGD